MALVAGHLYRALLDPGVSKASTAAAAEEPLMLASVRKEGRHRRAFARVVLSTPFIGGVLTATVLLRTAETLAR